MANIDKVSVKNTVYNIVSPAVVSDYIEVIGGACTKPDGYVEDEVILAKQNDVQLLFKATQDIAFGANIVENTNCVRTTLEEVLKSAGGGGGASSADQVSYDNSDSGLEAENVQEAVDELATNAGTASSQIQTLTNQVTGLLDNTEVNGAVNMLNFAHASEVVKGYTFTNTDGVVQVTGSRASGETGNADQNVTITLPKGTYKVSGCPSGGSENTWRLLVNINNGAKYALDYGDGAVFILTEESTLKVYCTIMANYSDTVNLTFKPMITVPSYKGDYVPYAKSNKELTEELTIGTVSATRNTDYLNGTNAVTFRKYGKMVSCEGYFQVTTAAARNEVLYTLAELPLASSFLLALRNTGEYGLLNVKPNGTVVVESNDGLPIGFYSLIGTFVLA